ncbi:MAG: hypothetical protein PGN16_04070 [Sphingomonas phyllosphaerae]|uniref:hypothetical protein n=1 Tax=Sphingomonas phyllosphaerae TaxID=257003 RepID=UPI002FF72798
MACYTLKERVAGGLAILGCVFAGVAITTDPFGQIGIGLLSAGYALNRYTQKGNGEKHGG